MGGETAHQNCTLCTFATIRRMLTPGETTFGSPALHTWGGEMKSWNTGECGILTAQITRPAEEEGRAGRAEYLFIAKYVGT